MGRKKPTGIPCHKVHRADWSLRERSQVMDASARMSRPAVPGKARMGESLFHAVLSRHDIVPGLGIWSQCSNPSIRSLQTVSTCLTRSNSYQIKHGRSVLQYRPVILLLLMRYLPDSRPYLANARDNSSIQKYQTVLRRESVFNAPTVRTYLLIRHDLSVLISARSLFHTPRTRLYAGPLPSSPHHSLSRQLGTVRGVLVTVLNRAVRVLGLS